MAILPLIQGRNFIMLRDWNEIPDELQLMLTRAALSRAAETIAGQAETLAEEIESGAITDQGGAEALRLLAAVVRFAETDQYQVAGHA
jgi:hypothetical protein